ncbi:MAG: phosphomannomutase/phosphoglucomutase [Agarilytica sp.]
MYENAKINSTIAWAVILLAAIFVVGVCFIVGRIIGQIVEERLREKALLSNAAQGGNVKSSDLVDPLYQKTDILNVDIAKEDEDLLGLEDVVEQEPKVDDVVEEDVLDIIEDDGSVPDVVFRAYDIRGIAKDQITNDFAKRVGQALGSEAIDNGQDTLIVARDARLTSPELTEFLIRGILSTGCHVLNIGTVPTPLMYFATATLKESQSGVMVTASHNPGNYNGFKVVMNGKTRCDDDIKAIRRRILKRDVYEGDGEEKRHDVVPEYIDTIFSDVALAGDVSIVIDAANGVTGKVAPSLFEELGCHVIPLYCDLDGNFPNHDPDPSIESNLQDLIAKVKETSADIGVAFDGDGDRLIVVTSSGQIIWPDQLLMMFAKDIVSRNPGADVVFDVKSTRHLASCVTGYGGRPIMWKTGHAPMKNKMLETGALLGGEYSGHIFIKDRWFGFDDGMYAAARLIEILSLQGETLDMMFNEFPKSPSTPEIRVAIDEEKKFDVVEQLASIGNFGEGRVTTIDGVRVDFPDGWGLVRASNTSANLTLRFEADDEEALHRVKSVIAKELKIVDNTITIDWNT